MDDPYDVGRCARCNRWQRRRHAYVEVFGPGDKEEWCVTGGCFATWMDGIELVLRARHDPRDAGCTCATCRDRAHAHPATAVVEWAADHGVIGALDDVAVSVPRRHAPA